MSIRLLHTSDWHLGKKLFKTSRIEEQKLFLNWLHDTILQEKIDVLLVAGDIFDTPHPPSDALKLYFDFLKRIGESSKCQVFIISGNHDSGKFLEAPKEILSEKRIHIVGQIFDQGKFNPQKFNYRFEKNNEAVEITLLPYFRSYELLNLGQQLTPKSIYQEENKGEYILSALEEFFKAVIPREEKNCPRFLMAHHLFGQYQMSGSEQGLSLSGLDTIPLRKLGEYFDYVALGHIHKTQVISKQGPEAYYSGSPIPFRFSESRNKSVAIIDIKDRKHHKRTLSIPSFRKLHSLETTPEKLQNELEHLKEVYKEKEQNLPVLLEVRVNLKDPQMGLADKIREELKGYPIELLSFQTHFTDDLKKEAKSKKEKYFSKLSTEEFFDLFYKKKHPESEQVPIEILEEFNLLVEDLRHQEEGH